jgi:cell division protein FtsB
MLKKFKLFIIIFIFVLIFLPGFAKLQEMKQKLSDIEAEVRKTQRENAILEEKIEQMKSNQEYLENVAREKMGVVKKGETVVKIVHEGEETPPLENSTAVNATKTQSP